jgi:hypothetical protein
MPEKRPTKRASAVRKTAPRPAPKKAAAKAAPSASEARLACPRCGTAKFGPEPRIRAEGTRTVRYTVLVCERGHTFARPRTGR